MFQVFVIVICTTGIFPQSFYKQDEERRRRKEKEREKEKQREREKEREREKVSCLLLLISLSTDCHFIGIFMYMHTCIRKKSNMYL